MCKLHNPGDTLKEVVSSGNGSLWHFTIELKCSPMRVSYCIFADYVYLCALDGVGLGLLCPKN